MNDKKSKRSHGTPMEAEKAIAKHFQEKAQGSSDQEQLFWFKDTHPIPKFFQNL